MGHFTSLWLNLGVACLRVPNVPAGRRVVYARAGAPGPTHGPEISAQTGILRGSNVPGDERCLAGIHCGVLRASDLAMEANPGYEHGWENAAESGISDLTTW